ncbi:V-type ATP synthase subunit D, partial [Sphaerisporangium rubeum]
RHAVALGAVRATEAEVAWTRRRTRALRERWIPGLAAALAERELALEEQERADWARMRRARDERPCDR